MRIEVGMVRTATRLTLGAAVIGCAVEAVSRNSGLAAPALSTGAVTHFFTCYGLTLIGFAAYPHSRRTDLVKGLVAAAALFEVGQALLGRGLHIDQCLADIAGAYAVLVPSFLERFRSLTRADQHEPFSMVYPNDRRRRQARKVKPQRQLGFANG